MDHPSIIVFPEGVQSQHRRPQFEAKVAEYRCRQATEFATAPVDGNPFWHLNNRAKIIILERVLTEGRVVRTELFRELYFVPATEQIVRYVDWQYGNPFHTAFDVIFDYVANGGANVSGGTGLPSTS